MKRRRHFIFFKSGVTHSFYLTSVGFLSDTKRLLAFFLPINQHPHGLSRVHDSFFVNTHELVFPGILYIVQSTFGTRLSARHTTSRCRFGSRRHSVSTGRRQYGRPRNGIGYTGSSSGVSITSHQTSTATGGGRSLSPRWIA